MKRGPVPVAEPSAPPYEAIGSPHGPSVSFTGPFDLSNCRSQSPGFNCIGPLGASESVGVGRT